MQDPVTAEHAHITASTARGRQPTQTETRFFFCFLFFLSELFVFSELHKRWCDAETWRRSHGNTQRRERGQRLGGGSSEGEGSEVRWTQTWCHMLVTERSRNLTSKSGHERQTEREREKNKQIHVFISTRMGGGVTSMLIMEDQGSSIVVIDWLIEGTTWFVVSHHIRLQ